MAMSTQEKNDAIIGALKHPIRREILRRLDNTNGGLSPKMVVEALAETKFRKKAALGNVAHHMRVLKEAGVIKLVKTTPRRGALEHFYKRTGNHLDRKAAELLQLVGKD